MKISSIKNNINSPNSKQVYFKARPWYSANLKELTSDGKYSFVPALVSRLDTCEREDHILVNELSKMWKKTVYFSAMAHSFLKQNDFLNFFIIETKGPEKLVNRIKGAMAIDNPSKPYLSKELSVRWLQSAPEIADNVNAPVRGAGELMLYTAAQVARTYKFNRLCIDSANNSFYRHMKLHEKEGTDTFYLNKKELNTFIENIENKYKFESACIPTQEVKEAPVSLHQWLVEFLCN